MNKEDFKETIFADDEYRAFNQRFTDMAKDAEIQIEALGNDDLPTDLDFIQRITKTENAFQNYIKQSAVEYIGKRFIPIDEKTRIHAVYNELHERLSNGVARLRQYVIEGLPLINTGGVATVDYGEIERMAQEAATYSVDVDRMGEYFSKIEQVKQAMDELRKYETSNGLPDFMDSSINGGLSYSKDGRLQRSNFETFYKSGGGEELFQQVARNYFVKK